MSKDQKRVIISLFVMITLGIVMVTFPTQATPESVEILSNDGPDYWPTEGWLTSTPEEQGMNSTILEEVGEYIIENEWTMDSVVVIRNGYIVYEIYPNSEYDVNTTHGLASAAKSITGALIGAALERGNISSLDETVVDFFSDRTIANRDANKEAMTVEDLLTMSSGLDWIEDGEDSGLWEMFKPVDFVQFILDLPMARAPGNHFSYSTGDTHLLSAIINQTTGKNAVEFGMEVLFEPLGISDVSWRTDNQGVILGGGWLNVTPRAVAKICFLYLNNGTWDGEQIIPSEYVKSSTMQHMYASTWNLYYGYHWWIDPSLDGYLMRGAHQQRFFVQPKNDLIVVITTPSFSEDLNVSYPMVGSSDFLIEQKIIPAIITESTTSPATPLPSVVDFPASFPLFISIVGIGAGVTIAVIVVFALRSRRM